MKRDNALKKSCYIFLWLVFLLVSINFVSALTAKIGNGKVVLNAKVGDIIKKSVKVINSNDFPVVIELSGDGDLKDQFKFSKNNFTLASNEETDIEYSLRVTKEGRSDSKINVKFTPLENSKGGIILPASVIIFASKGNNTINWSEIYFNQTDNNEVVITGEVNTKTKFVLMGFFSMIILSCLFLLLYFYQKKKNKLNKKNIKKKIYVYSLFLIFFVFSASSILAISGSVVPSRMDYYGEVGQSFQKSIIIKNSNDFGISVSASSTIPNIVLSQTVFSIDANSSYSLPFNMTIRKEGYEQGRINIRLKRSLEYLDLFTTINLYGVSPSEILNYSDLLNTNIANDSIDSVNIDSSTPVPSAGKDFIINVKIKNNKDTNISYFVSLTNYEDFAELLTIYPQSFSIEAGKSKDVKIQLYIKNNASSYKKFNIKINCNGSYEEFPVLINISNNFEDLKDIAYIVKDSRIVDPNFIGVIDELSYEYDVIESSELSTTNFSKYKMILLGDEKITGVPVNNYKSLFANPDYYVGWSASRAYTSNPKVYVSNRNISITKNLPQNFNAYYSPNTIYYLTQVKNGTKSVVTTGNSTFDLGHFVISVKENPRRVFFGITKSSYWTYESRELFKNSVKWVMEGEDKDNDGYFGDYDCNDNNPNLWRKIKAYVDKDKDGFGSGGLVDVCIGKSLLEGYSYIGKDCSDSNSNINPDMSEIPYNGIDEDCDGYDLADVDGDGYCKKGYFVQNAFAQCIKDIVGIGSDCNDWDASYNPGSDDLQMNCKNDAPFVGNVSKIVAFETERIVINVSARDPENDSLFYSINDTRFFKIGNMFFWDSGYEDAGNYVFEVIVGDGNITTISYVYVEVLEKNRVPLCDLKDISWYENENVTINLEEYCYDLDKDDIIYSLDRSGENIDARVENKKIYLSSREYWYGTSWIKLGLDDGKEKVVTYLSVKVNPVNQGPQLFEYIEEMDLYEDTNSVDSLNLNNYFFDVDSNLSYGVSGNDKIRIEIKEGLVSFYPEPGFVGNESVIFNANDGEFNISSNPVLINVLYVRKAPKFSNITCVDYLIEEEEYSCEFNAIDPENDSFSFSVIKTKNLNCTFEGNVLRYIGLKNYFGNASCVLRVKDNDGYNDFEFNVTIENVNDPPMIEDTYPQQTNVKIYNSSEKNFSINLEDLDSKELSVNWLINGEIVKNESVKNESYYNFKMPIGWYNILAIASDGEFNVATNWSVYVGPSNDFRCSEINGYVCGEKQVCMGEILNVYDSASCCSVMCSDKPPEFKDIRRENITNEISLEFLNPVAYNSTEFKTGKKIPVELKIENNAQEDINLEVFVYLYDADKEKIVEKVSDSFELGKKSSKTSILDIEIPRKINENDNFYVFAKVIGEKKRKTYYNEKFSKIKIVREEYDIVIDKVELYPKEVLCGDDLDVVIKIKNYGSKSQNAVVSVRSSIILENKEINSEIEDYYSNKNWEEENFKLKIKDDAKAGGYKVIVGVSYSDKKSEGEASIFLGECKKEETTIENFENEKTVGIRLESRIEKTDNRKLFFSLISFLIMLVTMFSSLVIIGYFKNRLK